MVTALLPGGISSPQGLRKDFRFKPINGAIELALSESSSLLNGPNPTSTPDAITHALSTALDHVGDLTASAELVANLCVADRQFLMQHLNLLLEQDARWYSATCKQCQAPFDFFLTLSNMPIKQAGLGYPFAEVQTRLGLCCFRLPNGQDQSALARVGNHSDSEITLINRCLISIDGVAVDHAVEFLETDKKAIEGALEAMAPELTCEVSTTCVECDASTRIAIDPYALSSIFTQHIMPDIHQLASHYHWSEHEILSLPRQRRQHYLKLIDAASNMPADTSLLEMQ